MLRAPIIADELVELFREKLKPLYPGKATPSVAIVPTSGRGDWTAVTSGIDRRKRPHLQSQVATIEEALQKRFSLTKS